MSKVIELTLSDALDLCKKQESDLFDRKSLKISGAKVQKIVVAFANADGGEAILGIADNSDEPDPEKRWQGHPITESFNSYIQAIFELNPTIDFRHEFLSCSALPGLVMRVTVQRSPDVCKTSDGTVYQRKSASSLPVKDPQRITALSFAKGATSFENSPIPELKPEEIVDSQEMARFASELSPAQEPLAYCLNEALLDRESLTPTCAGVLLFSDMPQPVFPRRCGVKITFYDTKQEIPERDHLKKNIAVEGPLYTLIHETVAQISDIMSSVSIMTNEGMKKVGYPPEAIWEIFANAVIHRDYSIADDVQVTIFQNRIEVKSPGRLPGFVTVNNFLDVRYSRNSKIVRSLAKYRNPPNKDLGEVLNTAFQKMKEWKLQSPISDRGWKLCVSYPSAHAARFTRGVGSRIFADAFRDSKS